MTTLIDVRLPHMGVVEQALLTSWLRSPGDRIAESDPLCEVSTDKVETEVESPVSGVLVGYVANVDDEVPVGAVIARFAPLDATEAEIAAAIESSAHGASAAAPVVQHRPAPIPKPPAPTPTGPAANGHAPTAARVVPPVLDVAPPDASLVLQAGWLPLPANVEPGPNGGEHGEDTLGSASDRRATPFVRRLAADRGLDLAEIVGTGPAGRITRKDVEEAAARDDTTAARAPWAGRDASPGTARAPKANSAPVRTGNVVVPLGFEHVAHEAITLTPQRRAIARNLIESVSTAPQVTAQVDVDMSAVSRVRADVNACRLARGETKLSFLPFIARALCAAVAEHPDLNATFTDEHLLRWRPVHLGVAVDAPQGLLVPVVHDAEKLTAPALADAINRLTGRVHDRSATGADLTGGTITLSNSGSVGGVTATPILTRGQVASLGVPAIVRTPVAVATADGEEFVAIRPIARFGLTFDHRAFDGVAALRALQSIQYKLETWSAEAYL